MAATHDLALLDALRDALDDGPLAAYASALRERGDPRAGLIERTRELALLSPDAPERPALTREVMTLEAADRARLGEALRLPPTSLIYRKGVVVAACCGRDEATRAWRDLARLTPARGLELRLFDDEAAWLRDPGLRGLRYLSIDNRIRAGDAIAREVASIATLEQLTLDNCGVGPEGVDAIARGLPRLRRLDLTHARVTARGAALLASPRSELTHLGLAYNDLGPDAVEALAVPGALPRLRVLDLQRNAIGADGARALARWEGLSRLDALELASNAIRAEGAAALAGASHDRAWTELGLAWNSLGDDGARALAGSSALSPIERLDLTTNAIGPDGARALARSSGLAGLRELALLRLSRARSEFTPDNTPDAAAVRLLRKRFGDGLRATLSPMLSAGAVMWRGP